MAKIANVYAGSLFELALEKDKLNETKEAFDDFIKIYDDNLKKIIINPIIPSDEKINLIDRICENSASIFKNFLKVLINKNREEYISDCYFEFNDMLSEHRNEINVEVKSAKKLSEEQLKSIKTNIENTTGKKVRILETIDASLLMGFDVLIDGELLDLSLNATFERLRNKLKKIEVKL